MRRVLLAAVVGAALLTTGCLVQALSPLYTESTTVFDPRLVGTWMGEGDTMAFAGAADGSYRLTFTEGQSGLSAHFVAYLIELDGMRFLDIDVDVQDFQQGFQAIHLLGVHTIWRAWIKGDVLLLSGLNYDWLKTRLTGGTIQLPYLPVGENILLTASTTDLQQFVRTYGDSEAFGYIMGLRRVK